MTEAIIYPCQTCINMFLLQQTNKNKIAAEILTKLSKLLSKLSKISKLLEKIIAKRIRSHLDSNDLLNCYQSAYRPMHSTETALLKVQNNLLRNLADGKTTVLVLLDLLEAFDTLDHSGVISLLKNWYGISGNAFR